jgi:hypothetical protein
LKIALKIVLIMEPLVIALKVTSNLVFWAMAADALN